MLFSQKRKCLNHSWVYLSTCVLALMASLKNSYKREEAQQFLFQHSPEGTFLLKVMHSQKLVQIICSWVWWCNMCNYLLPTLRGISPLLFPPPAWAPKLIPLYSLIPEMKEQWVWLINQPTQGRAVIEDSGCVPTGNKQAKRNLRVRNWNPQRTPDVL